MPLSTARSHRGELLAAAVAIAVASFSFAYRLLSPDLTDDDYLFYAIGRQIQQFGAWPVRDLLEEGDPLHNVVSAALQALFGFRLAGEIFFDVTMMSLAAALVCLLARAVSGSIVIATAVAVIAVLFTPRLYDYPKAVIPVLGLWLCFQYVERPSRPRAASLGFATGVAFLFRHDLGAFVGLASLTVLVARAATTNVTASGLGAYIIAVVACTLPYVLYVQVHGGVVAYAASVQGWVQREVGRDRDPRPAPTLDFSRPLVERAPGFPIKVRWAAELDEAVRAEIERRYGLDNGQRDEGRTWRYMLRDQRRENLRAIVYDPRIEDTANIDRTAFAQPVGPAPPSPVQRLRRWLREPPSMAIAPGIFTSNNAIAWLYYVVVGLPYLSLAAIGLPRLRGGSPPVGWSKVLAVSVVSAAAGPLWLRGNLNESSRLADLAGPSAVLGAWLIARSLAPRPGRLWARVCLATAAGVAYLLTVGSVVSFARVARGADAALLALDPEARRIEFDPRIREMLASPPPLSWLSKETGVRGAVEYLRGCTAPNDRVLVYGFYPEIVFFSGREAASDRVFLYRGFWTQPHEQQRTIEVMQRSRAPIVLIDVDAAGRPPAGRWLDSSMALIDRYLSRQYVSAGVTGFGASTGVTFNVLVEKERPPARIHEPFALPCFAQRDKTVRVNTPRISA